MPALVKASAVSLVSGVKAFHPAKKIYLYVSFF
jgi:hypothetical protein